MPGLNLQRLLFGAALLGAGLCHGGSPEGKSAGQPFVHQAWETFTTDEGRPDDSIRAVRVCGDKVWVGTDGGLALLEGGGWRTWTHLDREKTRPLPAIWAIDVDALTGDVWLGTGGAGIIRFSGGRFDSFDQFNSGLAGNLVFDLVVTGGRVWAATNGGISSFDPVGGSWSLYLERRADAPERAITCLSIDPTESVLYAGNWCGGLWLVDPSTGQTSEASADVPIPWPPAGPAAEPAAIEARTDAGGPVAIGVLSGAGKAIFLPGRNSQPAGGSGQVDVPAVQLAVQQANSRGGYRGTVPFAVALDESGYARYGWTLPEDDLVALAARADVLGIVGWLGPHCGYAAAAALRTEVPAVDAAPAQAAEGQPVHPWMFRCPGAEPHRQVELLDYVVDQLGPARLAVVRTPGPRAGIILDLTFRYARERGHPLPVDVTYDPQAGDLARVLEAIRHSRAEAVLTWCEAHVAADILRAMRAAGMKQLFVGGEQIVTSDFGELVGRDPGRVVGLWTCSGRGDPQEVAAFTSSYRARFRRSPKPEDFRSYDAARHLLRAIDLAGADRDAIGRTLREMSTACMARLEAGRWEFGPANRGRRSPAP